MSLVGERWAALVAVARADFRERARRRSFLVVTALLLWACFAAVPPPQNNFSLLALGDARGSYTSAWFGLMFGLVTVLMMPLPAFYLVRGAVNRDRETRVGPILAASPLPRWGYLAGKALSNFALLTAILAVVSLGAAGMFLLRGESGGLDVVQLWAPIWLMSLPVLAFVACLAVLFESLRGLRGGAGNVLYFFVWSIGLSLAVVATSGAGGKVEPQNDFLGISRPIAEAQARVAAVVPDYQGSFRVGVGNSGDEPTRVVAWPAMSWSVGRVGERLFWLWPSLVLLLGAVAAFDRFDPARRGAGWGSSVRGRGTVAAVGAVEADLASPAGRAASAVPELPPLVVPAGRQTGRGLGILVAAELRLMLRRQPWWWWAGLAGLIVASLASPLAAARQNLLPFLWIWPVLVWSPLGAREHHDGVTPLVASAPWAVWRPAIAGWGAGALLALGVAGALALRFALGGDYGAADAQLAGAAFVPALALAAGTLTRGSRTFEALYLLWWYLAANGAVPLDFMGRSAEAVAAGMPRAYAFLAVALLVMAILGRRRR
jgi:ABC-type transport system involved in multi-copper enzyme maturation permease subunit